MLQFMGSQRVGHLLSDFTFIHSRPHHMASLSCKGAEDSSPYIRSEQRTEHWWALVSLPQEPLRSYQISRSVVSDSLQPHESQHARPPCPSPTPRVHSDSGPSSQRCHPAILSSVVPFSSCPQSLPASKSFPMSQLFS